MGVWFPMGYEMVLWRFGIFIRRGNGRISRFHRRAMELDGRHHLIFMIPHLFCAFFMNLCLDKQVESFARLFTLEERQSIADCLLMNEH